MRNRHIWTFCSKYFKSFSGCAGKYNSDPKSTSRDENYEVKSKTNKTLCENYSELDIQSGGGGGDNKHEDTAKQIIQREKRTKKKKKKTRALMRGRTILSGPIYV